MKRIIFIGFLFCLFFLIMQCSRPYQPALHKAEWNDITIRATGLGAPPSESSNAAQARLLSCRAAKVDAYRNLIEQVYGVQIDSKTYVRDFITENDEIRTRVEGYVKRAKVINEKVNPDGSCEVTLELVLSKNFSEIIMQ